MDLNPYFHTSLRHCISLINMSCTKVTTCTVILCKMFLLISPQFVFFLTTKRLHYMTTQTLYLSWKLVESIHKSPTTLILVSPSIGVSPSFYYTVHRSSHCVCSSCMDNYCRCKNLPIWWQSKHDRQGYLNLQDWCFSWLL